MNIGDKVRVTKGKYKGLVGTVGNIMGEKVRIDNSRVDVFLWYNESELEPISDHMTADELAELIMTADELTELITATDEIDKLLSSVPTMSEEDEEVNYASGTADNTNQRTASGVDPYTAEIGDPAIKYWYDQGYKDGHNKGYRTGMQAVITNIKRFLKEITP